MYFSRWMLGIACILYIFGSVTAHAAPSDPAFVRGNALLAEGEFEQALQAYADAVRSDRTNQEYSQQYMLVRRIILLRQNLGQEQDPQKWQRTAQALHAFYISKAIYPEALAIAEKIHAKSNTALSAAQLAETQLAMGKNKEAALTLAALDPEKAIPATKALNAIALARQGQLQEARQIGEGITGAIPNDPGTLYSLARMHAAIGNNEKSLGILADCFAAIPPSRLDNLKRHAKQSPDFVTLADTPGFAKTLKTESKVVESKCSGGSSCAGCPMRGKCAMSQGG